MKLFLFEFSMKAHKFIGICFVIWLLLFIAACSATHSATIKSFQNAAVHNQNANVPNMVNVNRAIRNRNEHSNNEKLKPTVVSEKITRTLDCNNPTGYSLVLVGNPNREHEGDSFIPEDLNILATDKIISKVELPTGEEVKNFSLNSTKKTKEGFEMKVEWGGGLYHYEIQYNFRCKEGNFYLYKVRKENFSTKNPDSGNYWDKKEIKETKIEPNLPIGKFVMIDYLQ